MGGKDETPNRANKTGGKAGAKHHSTGTTTHTPRTVEPIEDRQVS
ncbi:hypothetical protein ATOBIA_N01140 [Atopobiaceae bacterium P1]|uniref:Uncharacterized protein n=1 Tax=Leptogranulimonas caecicola TaxID=2894156 RepID=A0AAU9D586_9ACTN|nr:hypothetical protein ATOBIA_N01140 [Atopobiaceae bacterium P1]BDC90244.1 hypothetical protein ATTO_01160 [Leptogranulimonas caecicola]